MKATHLFLLTIFASLLLSCVGSKDYEVISKEITTELPASGITSISINGPFTVNVVDDGSKSVTLVANRFIMDETTLNVNASGDLIATIGNVGSINQPEKFKLALTIPAKQLKSIQLNGAATCTFQPTEVCNEKGRFVLKGASRLSVKGDALFASDVEVQIDDAAVLLIEEGTFGVQGDVAFSLCKAGSAKINSAKFANKTTINLKDAAQLTLTGNQTNSDPVNTISTSDASQYCGFGFVFHKVDVLSKNVSQVEAAVVDYLGIRIYDVASVKYRKMSQSMSLDPLEIKGGSIKKVD